jgi:hypothetical protein
MASCNLWSRPWRSLPGKDGNEQRRNRWQNWHYATASIIIDVETAHTDRIRRWLDDTETLVDFILPKFPENAATVDGSDRAMVRNMKSWFNIRLRAKNGIHPDDVSAYDALRS